MSLSYEMNLLPKVLDTAWPFKPKLLRRSSKDGSVEDVGSVNIAGARAVQNDSKLLEHHGQFRVVLFCSGPAEEGPNPERGATENRISLRGGHQLSYSGVIFYLGFIRFARIAVSFFLIS